MEYTEILALSVLESILHGILTEKTEHGTINSSQRRLNITKVCTYFADNFGVSFKKLMEFVLIQFR